MARILPLLVLFGCPGIASRGFAVTLTFPDDGAEAAPTTPVRVAFSQAPDAFLCADGITLAGLGEDDRVAWEVPFDFEEEEGAERPNTWRLVNEEPLTLGVRHAIIVSNGLDGCVSERGDDVEPHVAVFRVVERQSE